MGWPAGPLHPWLGEGAVHVWRAALDELDGRTHARLAALLSEEERARAARLLSEDRRAYWTRSRGLLRTLLGLYLQADPRGLTLITDANGKPSLAGAGGEPAPKLSFNLSHSGALALYAFTSGAPVGVDVETNRRPLDEAAIAARALGGAAADRLRGMPDPDARRREFLRLWTRYEAELKCLGTGVGASAAGAGADAPVPSEHVWIHELDLGAGAAGAVACTRPPHELRCWDWPPTADPSCA